MIKGNTASAIYACQKRETTIDFEGHISVLFFTKGCNFMCRYCHNPELIAQGGQNMTYDKLAALLTRAKNNWIDAVCITGGEPLMQHNIAETCEFIKSRGLSLKLDTNGSFPETLKNVLPFCDYIAMDYKAPIAKYPALTGIGSVPQVQGTEPQQQEGTEPQNIAASLEILKNSAIPYEIRITVLPEFHKEDDIAAICTETGGGHKLVLQRFIPRDNLPDALLRKTEKTGDELLKKFAAICEGYFEKIMIR
ncbi:MAG: anaerobic ribonucleoside-triphosphate reductase activating protein [Leptospirales bacterium]|nr:anaerobic ribonucleoside-triphosphate reductase activating protein [Leptospirales bacterium]